MLEGKNILITGATGFVGKSLLRFWRDSKIIDLERVSIVGTGLSPASVEAARREFPFVDFKCADLIKPMDIGCEPEVIFHLASPASAELIKSDPAEMLKVIYLGCVNLADFAASLTRPPRVVFASSGAVYDWVGRQSPASEFEMSGPSPLDPSSCYGEGKRLAELVLNIEAVRHGFDFLSARLFAFGGQDLPLDRHFAIGNFVKDAIEGNVVRVLGNPSTVRSYLSARDLGNWLTKIALDGQSGVAYHIGSEQAITILDLASLVVDIASGIVRKSLSVEVAADGIQQTATYYVPSTSWTRNALGVTETESLREVICEMLETELSRRGRS